MEDLKTYFGTHPNGIGILVTSDKADEVEMPLYTRPHLLDDGTIGFVMREHQPYQLLQENPSAVFLFMEEDNRFKGKRLFLTRLREERDGPRLDSLRQQSSPGQSDKQDNSFLVIFNLDDVRPLVETSAA